MLELRPSCENCNKDLPANSTDAFICSFECTFCKSCVDTVLSNVCPNCGGGFEKRPVRPSSKLMKYPSSTSRVLNPVDIVSYESILNLNKDVKPERR